jgi:predicted ATPase/DNA-binding CsgD family transcriptional regulator
MIRNYSFGNPIPFVGRTKELAEITARLVDPDCRLLTLTGLGGSGKTRLALEAARTAAPNFPHGAVFVGLQPLTRSDLLVPAIAQAVGLTPYSEGDLHDQLLDYLQEKTLLLLLDNFEHLLDGAAFVTTMLADAPGVKVLVTSRVALCLQEEWLYPLKGLATPPSVYATELEDYEAVQLFLYHARRVQPHVDPTNDHEAVIRICQMTAGLPLAIELAASWLKGLRIAHIAHAMQCNLDFLSTTTRNGEERHRSMRAVFDQSWTFLSENERLIFARLSVFPGSFAGAAAEQVAGASFASLAALVEKSLVQLESADRFGIHELLRQYGMEQLEAYGETAATYARHSQYFAQLMLRHEAALRQPQQLETMQAIERDFDNIRLAWEWSAQNQRLTHLHTMLNGLYLFGFLGARYRETITIFQDTLDQSVADAPLRGRLLVRRWGYLQWWYQANYQEALTQIERALTIARAENNRFEIAFCQLMVAYALMSLRRYAEALPHLESSKALFEALDEPYYVCWVLHRLGYVYSNLNNTDKGTEYTEQSLALARVTHNRVALVICLYNLGSDYILDSDYVKGRHYGAEALQFATESGHQCQIAHAFSLLALYAFFQGDYTTCREYAERSRAIIEDIKLLVFQPYSLSLLILLACLREDYAEGVRLKELGKRHSTSKMDFQLHYWALAALSCGVGRPADVRVYIQKVLEVSDPEVNAVTTIWIVPSVAYAIIETDPEQAVELLAWVFAYPDTALSWVRHWPLLDRLQAQLQVVMDCDSYRMHWEKGKALTFDTINTYLQHEFRAAPEPGAEAAPQQLLTAREREILGLLAAGMTNPQIAAQLVIGAGTVKTHTLNIYRKLEVANRTQAIVHAQELGLLRA